MTSSVPVSICGDVERPACLALEEVRSLMDAEVVADFHCREGWSRLGERWPREQAQDSRVLLALEHEGAASPRRAGFPRLVGPREWECFLSVKSVDRIEVTRQPQPATAATIALARLEG
jgi:DMSO/TMAO reductase YedYZ molybdopterin-dependent catalytic subunit